MDIDELIDHYDSLLERHEWLLWIPFSWTVIHRQEPWDMELVGAQLAQGRDFRYAESSVRDASDLINEPFLFVQPFELGCWFLDIEDTVNTPQRLLARVGRGARLWSVTWPVTTHGYRFRHVEYGQESYRIDDFRNPSSVWSSLPSSLSRTLERISSAWISKPRRYLEAGVLAALTEETGALMDTGWLNGSHMVLISSALGDE